MAEKITYQDKVGVTIPGNPVNQVQDIDMNEIKNVVNTNADELALKVTKVTAGSNIVVDETIPTEPKVSSIPSTSAGVIDRVYFTGDTVTTSQGAFYRPQRNNKGSVADVTQTVSVSDDQKAFFAQDLLGDIQTIASNIPIGDFTAFLSVSTDSSSAQRRFTNEVYLCDVNGVPLNNPDVTAPVGSLGVRVVAILDSGIITMASGAVVNISMTGGVTISVPIAVNQRLRYHVSVAKVGTAGAVVGISLYYGSNYNSHLEAPTINTTSTTVNTSQTPGATSTDALNNHKDRLDCDNAIFTAINSSFAIDFNVKVQKITLSQAATTFTNLNFPVAPVTTVLELIVSGNSTITLPSNWVGLPNNDAYSTTKRNHFIVSATNLGTGNTEVLYSLTNMLT